MKPKVPNILVKKTHHFCIASLQSILEHAQKADLHWSLYQYFNTSKGAMSNSSHIQANKPEKAN